MKTLLLSISLVLGLSATELIYISKDVSEQSLKQLNEKYKQNIIVNDNRAYLAPSECIVSRYFGGESENVVNLPKSKTYANPTVITQEVFEAKNEEEIKEAIVKRVVIEEITGTAPKAFLGDKEGHLYAGESESPIDLSAQRTIVKEIEVVEIVEVVKPKEITKPKLKKKKIAKYKHPTCKLFKDGSGYELFGVDKPKYFENDMLEPIVENRVQFN